MVDGDVGPADSPPVGALLDLSGRVALVTGTGGGAIGAGIAARFAEAGAAAVLHYRASRQRAHDLAGRIVGAGGRAMAVEADLAIERQVKDLFDRAVLELGLPDVVVNNAGAYPLATILDMARDHSI